MGGRKEIFTALGKITIGQADHGSKAWDGNIRIGQRDTAAGVSNPVIHCPQGKNSDWLRAHGSKVGDGNSNGNEADGSEVVDCNGRQADSPVTTVSRSCLLMVCTTPRSICDGSP